MMAQKPVRNPADKELLDRWVRTRDPRAREELLERYLPYARSIARRFLAHNEPLEDLEQVAAFGLLKAIDRFDPQHEASLATYATPTIVGELRRHFRDRVWSLHVPRSIRDLAAQVTRASDQIASEQGRTATAGEIAERLGRSEEEIVEAIGGLSTRHALSLNATVGEGEDMERIEIIGDLDIGYDHVDTRASIAPLLELLDDRDREIVRLRFAEGLSQSQIAARVGISQMHVSRLLRRSLAVLREQLAEVEA